jgi:hypothetical protein
MHRLAEAIVAKVGEEADELLAAACRSGELARDGFAGAWWRIVRRVLLGDGARDEALVTDLLAELRADVNWAFLKPKRRNPRERFLAELRDHLASAEPGSLATLVGSSPAEPGTYPTEQVPQWAVCLRRGRDGELPGRLPCLTPIPMRSGAAGRSS